MTGIPFTSQQNAAIERRGGTILVNAAAGSGKTTVLVERIIGILTDEASPVDADRLLVATFTNAAASEMSAKIKRKLERLAAADPGNARIRRQALLLGRAHIGTVHAFCASLLRDHFNRLDIPADFAVADELATADLRRRALERTMDKLYALPGSEFKELCDLFGRARSDRDTAELIEKLYDFETNLAFPKEWEARVLEELAGNRPLAQTAVGQFLLAHAENLAASARDLVSEALEVASGDDALYAAYAPALTADFNFANALLARIAARDWDGAAELLETYNPKKLGSAKETEAGLRAATKDLRDSAKKIWCEKLSRQCFICRENETLADNAALLMPMRTLFNALAVFERELMALKLEQRRFEFSDLERLTVSLLCNPDKTPSDTARQLAEHYAYILVDEYQDTNEIQDLIFRLISKNETNLFFVGDIKQSIYGFRRADPEIFARRRDACYDDETGLFPAKIALPKNFRSARPVIEAVNNVFLPIMSRQTGGTDYAAPGECLLPRDDAPDTGASGLDLCLVARETPDAEPAAVAARIAELLRGGYEIIEKDGRRPCRESDICILLRSAKDRADAYIQALAAAGVRCWTDGGDQFFTASEVAVMLSLLRVLDNPRRDIDLAAVLLSPLFKFTPDDLARLRLVDRRASLYALVSAGNDAKTRYFLDTIKNLRAKKQILPVGELIQLATELLDAEITLCAGENYARRRDNLRLLVEYASGFDTASGGQLPAFLRLCDNAAQGKNGLRRDFAPPADAVCLTTAHKSKGLEWPVVFVVNAEKRFNQSDSNDPAMLFDAALGAGARIRRETPDGSALFAHRTLDYAALSIASQKRTVSEEMRILYVALTRARQKIIVTAALKDPQNEMAKWQTKSRRAVGYAAASAQSWLDWLGLAAAVAGALPDAADTTPARAGSISVSVIDQLPAPAAATFPPSVQADPALTEAINRRAAFRYSRAALSGVPGKLAVTDLAGEPHASALYRPAFSRDSLSPAQRGNAIHVFLQCADYARAALSPQAELDRLVAAEYLSPAAAQTIDLSKIKLFFESELGQKAAGDHVLREYAFIDVIEAGTLYPDLPPALAGEKIMLQGIADCVILEPDGAILLDYKSDRVSDASQLAGRYARQLEYYRAALNKQLPVSVKSCVIYSLELGEAVEIAPGETAEV